MKYMLHLYPEAHRAFMTEIKDYLSQWGDTLCLWAGKINIVMMSIILFYRFITVPIKISE